MKHFFFENLLISFAITSIYLDDVSEEMRIVTGRLITHSKLSYSTFCIC